MYLFYYTGDHPRQDSMDFSNEWGDPSNCRCGDRLKALERRAARQHQRCLAHSLVGTPNYIAPEVLLRTGRRLSCKESQYACRPGEYGQWFRFTIKVLIL